MAKINSVVELCNLALLKLAQPPISSLNDNTPQAIYCNIVYENSLAEVMAKYDWSFLITRVKSKGVNENSVNDVAVDSDDDAFKQDYGGYMYKHIVPAESSRILNIYDTGTETPKSAYYVRKQQYVIRSGYIFTDDEIIAIEYVKNTCTIAQMPEWFKQLFAFAMAINLSDFFSMSMSHKQLLSQQYEMLSERSAASDFGEGLSGTLLNTSLLEKVGYWW